MTPVLLDTGPLVAYLNRTDQYHGWAIRQFDALQEPVLTCEPVWAEAAHLMTKRGGTPASLWPLMRRGVVQFAYGLKEDYEAVAALMRRYEALPMSLADACLVRMSELNPDCRVLTTDSHFHIYRRFGRQAVPTVSPG